MKQLLKVVYIVLVVGMTLTLISKVYTDYVDIQIAEGSLEKMTFDDNNSPEYEATIRIESSAGYSCSAVVFANEYALTAGHCVSDSFLLLDEESSFRAYDSSNTYIVGGIKAAALSLSRDLGLIHGNFSKFFKAPVDFTGQLVPKIGDSMISCGYPSGQASVYCAQLIRTGNYMFQIKATGGPIFRGCSGGPVFDPLTYTVVGINSAVSEGGILLGSPVGFLSDIGVL